MPTCGDRLSAEAEKQLCVVIDTNIWRKTVMLRSSLGIALIYAIRQGDGKIGLPEVIEREVKKHGLKIGLKATVDIKKGQRQLERLLDKTIHFAVPKETELRGGIEKRLGQLDSLFERVPLTVEHTIRSLDRVDARAAPSAGKQEYKDALIWEATLDLAKRFRVLLLSEDSGFFRGKELAPSLQQECAENGLFVQGFQSLEACLTALAPTVPASYSSDTREKIKASLREWTERQLVEAEYDGRVSQEVDLRLFATEDPARFALSFTTGGDVLGGAGKPYGYEGDGTFKLEASGSVDITDGSILDLSGPTIEATWELPDPEGGRPLRRTSVTLGGQLGLVVLGPTVEALRDSNWLQLRENE